MTTIQSEIDDEIRSAIESKEISRQILRELREIIAFCSASVQLIQEDARTLLAGDGFDDTKADRGFLSPVSADPLITRVVASREPLILSDTTKDPHWRSHSGTGDVQSWIGLPVVHEDEVIGLLTLDHTQTDYYQDPMKGPLVAFANRIAPRIWRARLWNSAQRLIRDMQIVHDFLQISSSKLNSEDLVRAITVKIAETLSCTHCTLFFPQEEQGPLVLEAKETHGGGRQTMDRRFADGKSLAEWVFTHGKSVIVPDAERDSRFAPAREGSGQPRSMLVAPIKVGNQTIGVISADQNVYGWFNENDRRLVDTLAQQIGIAIQRSNSVHLIQTIGKRILSHPNVSVKDILIEVVSGAIRLINATTGVIYLISDDGLSVLHTYFPEGFNHPAPRLNKEDGLTRTVLRTRDVVIIPDLDHNSRVHPLLRATFKSIIGVPLIIREQAIGVFYLNDTKSHIFTENEVSLLTTLATQAAIAIQNATLVETLQRQLTLRSLLEDVLQHLVVHEQDQEGALETIAKGIRAILGDQVSPTINLYDEETDNFGECHAYGPLADKLRVPPRDEGGTGKYVVYTRMPLYLDDVLHPPMDRPNIRAESIDFGIRSFAAIPLKRQDKVVGVLFINSQKSLQFDDEIQRMLGIFANHAGIAIEIARLHESARIYGALVKAADIGYIASGISHDFYTNLQNMKSLLYQIRDAQKVAVREALLDEAEDEIARASKAIDTFCGFRDLGGAVERVNMRALVGQLLSISAGRAKRHNVEIVCHNVYREDVRIDPHLVTSILMNLFRNALEAVENSSGKKQIEIEVIYTKNDEIEIIVKDTGPGIHPKDREKIFLPFFTTKTGSRNMGIGLFWVQRIVDQMRGSIKIEVNNALGGAIFRVILPVGDRFQAGS